MSTALVSITIAICALLAGPGPAPDVIPAASMGAGEPDLRTRTPASRVLRGDASWVRASLGSRYLAARLPRGTVLRICSRACVTRTVTDYGPSKRRHPDRIVDLSRADFARTCGDPERLGVCAVRVTVLGRLPAMPDTSTEGR